MTTKLKPFRIAWFEKVDGGGEKREEEVIYAVSKSAAKAMATQVLNRTLGSANWRWE